MAAQYQEHHRHLDHNQEMTLAADFIATKGCQFHDAFRVPSILNPSTMQYECPEVSDLRETLECHQEKAGKYVDFAPDLTKCTWDNVISELRKAQEKAAESEMRGRNGLNKAWRVLGTAGTVLAPGLAAIPDELHLLHGGLAVIFSLARHSEMNRLKILAAFESVPNIIEEARNKSHMFPFDEKKPKTVSLHRNIQGLQETLLRVLPALINRLIPGTWRNAWQSPFGAWKIDKLLDEVKHSAETVRISSDALMDDIILGNYAASMSIKSQLDEIRLQQHLMHMSIKATSSQTDLLHFLMEQFATPLRILTGPGLPDVHEMRTALPGYTPDDLLMIMDVNHGQAKHDARRVLRRFSSFDPQDLDKASQMGLAPEVTGLLGGYGPGIVAVDGHFDMTQMGKISPLSCISALTVEALRFRTAEALASDSPNSPISPQPDKGRARTVVLEYYCALHVAENDNLYGLNGLMRCLTTQLILSLMANEWVLQEDPVHLPHLRDAEEELLNKKDLGAVCRLFIGLLQLAPHGSSVYCIVDGWSVYERNEALKADYEIVLDTFRDATNAQNFDAGASFKLLLTSPTMCRQLGDLLLPGEKVSLRNRDGGSRGNGRGLGRGRGGPFGISRAATVSDI